MNIKSFKIQIFHVFYLQKEKRKKKKKSNVRDTTYFTTIYLQTDMTI